MLINFNYETSFKLDKESHYSDWISRVIHFENSSTGDLNYIFCDDNYLHNINLQYLNHDTYTDIITFDYSDQGLISGDIFISLERVTDNANIFNVPVTEELQRVMIHGVLHMLGYSDKTDEDKRLMRMKENQLIQLFHVEQ